MTPHQAFKKDRPSAEDGLASEVPNADDTLSITSADEKTKALSFEGPRQISHGATDTSDRIVDSAQEVFDRTFRLIRDAETAQFRSALDVADAYYKAAMTYDEGSQGRKNLIKKLRRNSSYITKQIAIGSTAAFRDPEVMPFLPESWTTLYELRGLSKERLLEGIRHKAICPFAKRRDIKKWTQKVGVLQPWQEEEKPKPLASLTIPVGATEAQIAMMKSAVEALRKVGLAVAFAKEFKFGSTKKPDLDHNES